MKLAVPRSPWLRSALVLPFFAAVGLMLYWRGPDWNVVYHAFDFVNWAWVAFALVLNLASVLMRALAWQLTIVEALDPPDPPFNRTFSAFAIGLLGNAALPGRIGELARVAVLRRRLPHGRGTSAALVGTVFAHRLFDLFPALILVGYVLATAKIPHWATTSLAIVATIGIALLTFAMLSARRGHRPSVEGAQTVRRLLAMARQGLAVLKAPAPAAGAILLQCFGWTLQLLAVYVSMRAFDIHAPLPAAALVLLLMNVATIFPLWPGNIGLLQAAVALPLVQYGVPYSTGFAYGLVLQVDRDVRRRGRRPDLPRARGDVVRDAAAAAAADRAAGRGGPGLGRGGACSRWRARLASRASSRPPPAAAALAEGLRAGGASVRELPVADGGEGTAETLHAALGGAWHEADVHDAFGRPRRARWLLLPDGTAVVESAAAVPLDPERLDPLAASSRGYGELVAAALEEEPSALLLCLGGTATMDGGVGFLEAVDELPVPARVACDVRATLAEAPRLFGPQKGATPAEVAELERRLAGLFDPGPGGGAAGGLGAALASLGAELAPGAAARARRDRLRSGRVRPRRDGRGSGRRDDGARKGAG